MEIFEIILFFIIAVVVILIIVFIVKEEKKNKVMGKILSDKVRKLVCHGGIENFTAGNTSYLYDVSNLNKEEFLYIGVDIERRKVCFVYSLKEYYVYEFNHIRSVELIKEVKNIKQTTKGEGNSKIEIEKGPFSGGFGGNRTKVIETETEDLISVELKVVVEDYIEPIHRLQLDIEVAEEWKERLLIFKNMEVV